MINLHQEKKTFKNKYGEEVEYYQYYVLVKIENEDFKVYCTFEKGDRKLVKKAFENNAKRK